jgi:hypothetical protein
MKFFIGVIAV